MLGKLGEHLQSAIKRLTGAALLDEKTVNRAVKDIQRALISSDVDIELVSQLSERIKQRYTQAKKPPKGMSERQYIVRIVYEELTALLGQAKKPPMGKSKILLVGLYGSGKTTTCAKIAKHYQKRGLKPALISTDTWRPAAFDQLKQLAKKINVPIYANKKKENATDILKSGITELKKSDVLIVDSAGRDAVDETLITEIKEVNKLLKPDEKWLVLSGDIGQKAGDIAESFNEYVGLTGVIMTKMEGTAKGGGALSAVAYAKIPVVFIGTGETLDKLEEFDAKRFLQRLLGMGDLKALMEKAQEIEEGDFNIQDLLTGDYTLKTFYKQLQAQKKMGPLKEIFQMLGVQAKIPADILSTTEERLKRYKYIMDSMTERELASPDLLNRERMERIAKGSGTSVSDIKKLVGDFGRSKKLLRMVKRGKMPRAFRGLASKLKGKELPLE